MRNNLGCFIIDLVSSELSPEEQELLQHPLIGGVILFTRNYESRAQLVHLCSSIRSCRKSPILIMVDQEGGRVQRFIHEFTRIPAMNHFGVLYERNKSEALSLTRQCGELMASELLSCGVDLSLAPVLDLNKGLNTVIDTRAFHSEAEVVITLAKAFIHGMSNVGMAATGKHFPGHGSVTADSHHALPIDKRTLDEVTFDDMRVFQALIRTHHLQAVMAAHIVFPEVDDRTVGFSRRWLHNILRKQLGFNGVIFSDDLNMAGAQISSNYVDRFIAARDAGCDFVLLCNNRSAVIQVVDQVAYHPHLLGHHLWGGLQGQFALNPTESSANKRYQQIRAHCQSLV